MKAVGGSFDKLRRYCDQWKSSNCLTAARRPSQLDVWYVVEIELLYFADKVGHCCCQRCSFFMVMQPTYMNRSPLQGVVFGIRRFRDNCKSIEQ